MAKGIYQNNYLYILQDQITEGKENDINKNTYLHLKNNQVPYIKCKCIIGSHILVTRNRPPRLNSTNY